MVREDINLTRATKQDLNDVVDAEHEKDDANDYQRRSRSAIVDMLIRKGIRAWRIETQQPQREPLIQA
jgi:hypothetical protein